ncbi:MAG: TGS domain-containing protein, partial [Candidatus Amulumruptor sp.]|nr:TGS domain-containing protein [Candidatus Amulumruptor sp.]
QIRSRRMDEIAEKGFAAHWKYKIGDNSDEESELNVWLRTIKDILDDPNPNAIDFLDTLKLNLFASEIVVFTPKGELVTLPAGATVLDMAYSLHSQLGDKCIAGKVNHKLVPLSHKLSSGDQVEVLTSQNQVPKPEWLEFLATAKARTRLRAALRRIQQPDIDRGREMVADYLREREVEPTNEVITKMMAYFHVTTREDLYLRLGRGDITLEGYIVRRDNDKGILRKILSLGRRKSADKSDSGSAPTVAPVPSGINTKAPYCLHCGDDGQNFIFSDCCRPIPGDDVMGFINDLGQVEVHSLTCPRAQVLKATYGNRLLSTTWEVISQKFQIGMLIRGIDRHGILTELTALISTQLGIDIRALHIEADNEVFECRLEVKVEDRGVADQLMVKLRKIKGVESVVRI